MAWQITPIYNNNNNNNSSEYKKHLLCIGMCVAYFVSLPSQVGAKKQKKKAGYVSGCRDLCLNYKQTEWHTYPYMSARMYVCTCICTYVCMHGHAGDCVRYMTMCCVRVYSTLHTYTRKHTHINMKTIRCVCPPPLFRCPSIPTWAPVWVWVNEF